MYFLSLELTALLAVGLTGPACSSYASAPRSSGREGGKADTSTVSTGATSDDLCGGRERCRTDVLKDEKEYGVRVVRVSLSPPPGVTDDAERCTRREYWIARPPALIAFDCDVQWGADQAGPAILKFQDGKLLVVYEEFQSSDRCERVDAVLQLSPVSVLKQLRRVGVVKNNKCIANRKAMTAGPGNGSNRPLITLHREGGIND